MDEATRQKLLNPEPGSALAAARDYGIDLHRLIRNLEMTPDERLRAAVQSQELARTIKKIRKQSGRD